MVGSTRFLDDATTRIEEASTLDKAADALARVARTFIRPGPVEDVLSGTPIGHPAHPALVSAPIGAWLSALVLDATGSSEAAARRLTGFGLLAALPAGATGASDWLSTSGAERRVGLVHAVANYAAIGAQAASWQARRRGHRGTGTALSLFGATLVGAAGWLGGHLAYSLGVGVDTTAFQSLPDEWTDVTAESDIGADPVVVEVDAVPIVLFRTGDEIAALADRCSHRGGPLHEGTVQDGCITCPWHASVFDSEGRVRSGPATRPQTRLDVRVTDGRIEVRRKEARDLRQNPAGR